MDLNYEKDKQEGDGVTPRVKALCVGMQFLP